jgi:hypothetical protein
MTKGTNDGNDGGLPAIFGVTSQDSARCVWDISILNFGFVWDLVFRIWSFGRMRAQRHG